MIEWQRSGPEPGKDYSDILCDTAEGIAKITINRPEVRNAREIWYLCRQYDARQALEMGLVNAVVPLAQLEEETVTWAREMLAKSPLALRMLKGALNAVTDGAAGMNQFAGDATLLYYPSEEAQEGRNAYQQKRKPDFARCP